MEWNGMDVNDLLVEKVLFYCIFINFLFIYFCVFVCRRKFTKAFFIYIYIFIFKIKIKIMVCLNDSCHSQYGICVQ
jgi:hypothetical protein